MVQYLIDQSHDVFVYNVVNVILTVSCKGGDMSTLGGPYDPVFYAIHSFVDMLYWEWQQRGNNKFKFPGAYGNIPMVPFNIPPKIGRAHV